MRDWSMLLSVCLAALFLSCGSGNGDSSEILPELDGTVDGAPADTACLDATGEQISGADLDSSPLEESFSEVDALADVTDPEQRFEPLIAAIQMELTAMGAPGAAFAIIENGEVTFARGFGTKKPGEQNDVQASTLFRIGSTTKMLTAAGLLQQVEAASISLDTPLVEVVPQFTLAGAAQLADTLTLRQLLTHSSGIVDYGADNADEEYQGEEALSSFFTTGFPDIGYFMVPPGTFYNYSNPGFMLAGLASQELASKPYREVLEQGLFQPLGMSRTFFLTQDVLDDGDYAWGVTATPGYGGLVGPESYNNPWGWPAGVGTWSSVLDMAEFTRFLLLGDSNVLSDSTRLAMQTQQLSLQEAREHMGYGYGLMTHDGIFLATAQTEDGTPVDMWVPASQIAYVRALPNYQGETFYDVPLVEHGGDISGYAADVRFIPSLGFGFVALANMDGAHFSHSFAVALETLAPLPEPVAPPGDLELDPTHLDGFVGNYLDPYSVGRIDVSNVDGVLQISMPDLDAAEVAYEPVAIQLAPELFLAIVEGEGIAVTFVADESGTFTYLRTRIAVAIRQGKRTPVRSLAVDARRLRRLLAASRDRVPR